MPASTVRPEMFAAAHTFLIDYLNYRPHERVVITTDTAGDQDVVQSIVAAAMAAGGRPVTLTIPQLPYQGKLADPYLPSPVAAAVQDCDVWIDLTFPYIAGSELHAATMARKSVRYMLSSDMNGGGLMRMFGRTALDEVFTEQARIDAMFAASVGSTVRIATPLGTDVSFKLAKPHAQRRRRAEEPGLYTIPGSSTMDPELESVRGRIVVETVFHEFYTHLNEPIAIEVDGRIRTVSGGGPELATLERALLRAGGGQFGYIIHFTHGMHPDARFTGKCFVEDMRVIGCNAVGMGLPWWVPGGGENHPDAVLSMQSVWLDNRLIIDKGKAVGDGAAKAAPRQAA